MTDHDTFLQAILELPDDDVPRLQYADWLEEQGDPRGEFIRLQCLLATRNEADDRWPALQDREHQLLVTHQSAWAGRLRHSVKEWRFHRGFIPEVRLSARVLDCLGDEIFQKNPIQILRIRNATGCGRSVAACKYLARLTVLDHGLVGPEDLRQLTSSPHLNGLRGLMVYATIEEGLPLLGVPHWLPLRSLYVGRAHHQAETDPVHYLLPPAGRALLLRPPRETVEPEGIRFLAYSPHLANLTTLCLAGTQLTPSGAGWLAASPNLSALERLDLSRNRLWDEGVAALTSSPALGRLRTLMLGSNALTDVAVRELADAPYLKQLVHLDLSGNAGVSTFWRRAEGIGDEGARALARSPIMSRLKSLDLAENQIGDAGATALATSSYLSGLSRLVLADNRIHRAGERALRARFGSRVEL